MGGGKKKKKKKRERERERERGGGEELRALVTLVIQTLAAMSKTISSDSLYRMDGVKDRWGEEEEEEEEREREREREGGGGGAQGTGNSSDPNIGSNEQNDLQ